MKPITDFPFDPSLLTDKKYFWNRKTKEELELPTNGAEDHQALLAICQENRKLFRMISTFVPTTDGWASVQKACAMSALVIAMKPKTICEIGVFGGRSLIPMALALQANGSGKIVGIDPYSAEASTAGEVGQTLEWWNNQKMHDDVLAKFLGYLAAFKLDSVTHLILKKSDDADVPSEIDILHIDGSHTEQSVRDAERFGKNVRLGGIIVNDDLHWGGGGPLRAIDVLEEELGFRECYRVTQASNGESDDWCIHQRLK